MAKASDPGVTTCATPCGWRVPQTLGQMTYSWISPVIGWSGRSCVEVGALVGQSSELTPYPRSPAFAGVGEEAGEDDVGLSEVVGVAVGVEVHPDRTPTNSSDATTGAEAQRVTPITPG